MVHNGKYALVTGAASGMGREYARALGKMGYGIVAVDINAPALESFRAEMEKAGNGYVLNISSICAWMDWPIKGMYGNTKRFVKGYSRSLRVEERVTGSPVSITTAYFGAVDTPLFGFSDKARHTMKRLGVMISPEKAVSKALDAMFRRKKQITPGILNKVAIPVVSLIPDWPSLSFS